MLLYTVCLHVYAVIDSSTLFLTLASIIQTGKIKSLLWLGFSHPRKSLLTSKVYYYRRIPYCGHEEDISICILNPRSVLIICFRLIFAVKTLLLNKGRCFIHCVLAWGLEDSVRASRPDCGYDAVQGCLASSGMAPIPAETLRYSN